MKLKVPPKSPVRTLWKNKTAKIQIKYSGQNYIMLISLNMITDVVYILGIILYFKYWKFLESCGKRFQFWHNSIGWVKIPCWNKKVIVTLVTFKKFFGALKTLLRPPRLRGVDPGGYGGHMDWSLCCGVARFGQMGGILNLWVRKNPLEKPLFFENLTFVGHLYSQRSVLIYR